MGSALIERVAVESSGCAHCGLPAALGDVYCCYGCELAAEIHRDGARDHARLYGRLVFSLLLAMSVMMLSLFLYAEDIYGADGGLEWLRRAYRWASLALSTPVIGLCGVPLIRRSWRHLSAGRLSMDALIVTASMTAYVVSAVAVLSGSGAVYFESAVAALVLATLGRYLEATARSNASRNLAPSIEVARAVVLAAEGDSEFLPTSPARIRPGMRVRVALEQVVPVDIRLTTGPAEVSVGVLTGETAPVTVQVGDVVVAGAVVIGGEVEGEALHAARDSTLARLAELARNLSLHPSKLLRMSDRFARLLTPIVWIVAIATSIAWTIAASFDVGVVNALAVVLVACPCSYAIAAPLVHWVTLRRALAEGVVIRTAETLEALAAIDRVAFDKTGTLTELRPSVIDVALAPGVDLEDARTLVAGLEQDSRHPIARALVTWASAAPAEITDRRVVVGCGVRGVDSHGNIVAIGHSAWALNLDAPPRSASQSGPSVQPAMDGAVTLVRSGEALATLDLCEVLRPDAAEAVRALVADDIEVFMLTGDASVRADAIAAELEICVQSQLTPSDKVREMRNLGPTAAMVGDGLNDAPALASGVSFATGGGAELSRGLAGVSLSSDDLRLVPWALRLARRSVTTVRRLLVLSTLYNAVFVALAAAGLLRPVFAGLSMLISSLLTIAFATNAASVPNVANLATAPTPSSGPSAPSEPSPASDQVVEPAEVTC